MKGEERVCHVTEADRPGATAQGVSEKCLHVRPLVRGLSPWGLAPVRGGVTASSCDESSCDEGRRDQAQGRASGGCLGTERR